MGLEDSDVHRAHAAAVAICDSFGSGSRIVEVAEIEAGSIFSVTFELPKKDEQTDEEWWMELNGLRDELEAIDGVGSVQLVIGTRAS